MIVGKVFKSLEALAFLSVECVDNWKAGVLLMENLSQSLAGHLVPHCTHVTIRAVLSFTLNWMTSFLNKHKKGSQLCLIVDA